MKELMSKGDDDESEINFSENENENDSNSIISINGKTNIKKNPKSMKNQILVNL
jgi:hypothetical protein